MNMKLTYFDIVFLQGQHVQLLQDGQRCQRLEKTTKIKVGMRVVSFMSWLHLWCQHLTQLSVVCSLLICCDVCVPVVSLYRSVPHTHTHTFTGPLSGTTQVSRYQTGKTNLDFTGGRDSEWQWHQLGHTLVCTSLQTDNHASTPPLSFFTGRMPFLPPNQQRQSTAVDYLEWSLLNILQA